MSYGTTLRTILRVRVSAAPGWRTVMVTAVPSSPRKRSTTAVRLRPVMLSPSPATIRSPGLALGPGQHARQAAQEHRRPIRRLDVPVRHELGKHPGAMGEDLGFLGGRGGRAGATCQESNETPAQDEHSVHALPPREREPAYPT